MKKSPIKYGFLFFALFLVLKLWHPFWRSDLNDAADPNDDSQVVFEIYNGEAAKHTGKTLEREGLIENDISFIRHLKDTGLDRKIHYGSFVLSPSMTLEEVVAVLTSEAGGGNVVRFLEGWTIEEMDAQLAAMDLIESGEFIACTKNCSFNHDFLTHVKSLEGFLFPDTYFVDRNTFDVENFINQLLNTFDTRFDEEMEAALASSGRSWEETMIVASMIEKEVRTTKDLPIVSGIIWKRYDNDWALGIDATLLYVQDDNILTASDLRDPSPYNTRLLKGLPPTPICNPSLASIKAALYPEETEHWFYLTTLDTGEVIYAKTNAEHEANKDKYL